MEPAHDIDRSGIEQRSHVYVVRNGALDIEAPIETVWPLLVDYASWQNYSVQEHVSGEPGGEGEVILLKKDEPGSPPAPYYARTIRIVPGEQVIWKTFRDGDDYFGIVDFSVSDLGGGRTAFHYRNLYEYVIPTTDPGEVAAFRREKEEGHSALRATIFPRLKQLAETGE